MPCYLYHQIWQMILDIFVGYLLQLSVGCQKILNNSPLSEFLDGMHTGILFSIG